MNRGRPPCKDVLTPREWEVLALVERGLKNEEIAKRLGISPTTAKYHVSQILMKLDVANRREAGVWRLRRVPAVMSLLKGGAFLAGTAAIAAIIYVALGALLLQDSRTGATAMGKVAYIADGDVWVKQLPDGPEERLTKWGDVINDVQWSASGEWLTVRREKPWTEPAPPGGCCGGSRMDRTWWIIDADGKRERMLDRGMPGRWSPVKDELLIDGRTADGRNAIFIEQPDGSRRVVMQSEDRKLVGGAFGWTPSGEWIIAEVSYLNGGPTPPIRSLARVRPDGTDEREFYRVARSECVNASSVTREPCHTSPVAADPRFREPLPMYGILTNTQMIATSVTSDPSIVPLPANPVRSISFDAGNGVASGGAIWSDLAVPSSGTYFAFSPTSDRIATVVGPTDNFESPIDKRIALFDPSSGRLEYLTAPGEAAVHPSWSPDGGTLFFAAADGSTDAQADSDPIASHRIWSMNADGSNRKQLTNDPRYRDEKPGMTADGNLLFSRIDLEGEGSTASLWLLELATGKLEPVVDGLEAGFMEDSLIGPPNTPWHMAFDWWQPK